CAAARAPLLAPPESAAAAADWRRQYRLATAFAPHAARDAVRDARSNRPPRQPPGRPGTGRAFAGFTRVRSSERSRLEPALRRSRSVDGPIQARATSMGPADLR